MKRFFVLLSFANFLYALPFLSRKFNLSCVECHIAYSKPSYFGEIVRENLYLPPNTNPRLQTLDARGDKKAYIQRELPISGRFRTIMGLVSSEGKFRGNTSSYLTLYSSTNLSGNSSFFLSLEVGKDSILLRYATLSVKLPISSSLTFGKTDMSEFFLRRSWRITYQDFLPYDFAGLYGMGASLRLSPYMWFGVLDVEKGKFFARAGYNSRFVSFGVFTVPYGEFYMGDSYVLGHRHGLDFRVRFGPFDLTTSTILGFDQKLGEFSFDKPSFIAGYSSLDLTFGYNFFFSILYNYIGSKYEEYQRRYHKSLITFTFGHYPLRNLKVGFEFGYNTAKRYPSEGSYGGLVLDWAF